MSWNRFEKFEEIGRGGMGRVFRAYDRETGAIVALKELRPDLLRKKDLLRFLREIKNLQRVTSENVVRIVAAHPSSEYPAYAVEYCPGGDLGVWLGRKRTLAKKNAAFVQICNGVAALHSPHRIIHRDLKPSNILLGADGQFKVADLGLSVSLADASTRLTTSNWVSPGFSPPEQYSGMARLTEASDVYSLGAVLLFMFTGRDCSTSPNLRDRLLPRPLKELLPHMLAKDQKTRLRKVKVIRGMFERLWESENTNTVSRCPQCGSPAVGGPDPTDLPEEWVCCYSCGFEASDGTE